MKPFIAVMEATADNRIAKYLDFDLQQEAQDHVDAHIGNYPNAFVHAKPVDVDSHWRIDMALKTMAIDVPVIVPPTDTERFDKMFPQTDTSDVLVEIFGEIINKVIDLENKVNGTSKLSLNTNDVQDWLKSKLK